MYFLKRIYHWNWGVCVCVCVCVVCAYPIPFAVNVCTLVCACTQQYNMDGFTHNMKFLHGHGWLYTTPFHLPTESHHVRYIPTTKQHPPTPSTVCSYYRQTFIYKANERGGCRGGQGNYCDPYKLFLWRVPHIGHSPILISIIVIVIIIYY